ncbi:hypothetical protein PACTADRAFT_19111 [Pachysolen tannophilus NRRL Y-2460]|uniref:Histone H1 n=1 Tax=Pachysolen tannophilus NRRL Y-2460 TaxID=669874 RepID=A0A1E4TMR8_PACTA|nr:hypothetical protein PACTADRAFT_19111 [Pachysolen tannophilus NRRL Y-2460]
MIMAPKTATKKSVSSDSKKTYKELISIAIASKKERNGSSRQALKKYIADHFSVGSNFDTQFNLALKRGVVSGDFIQPKGSSGPVKLAKKEKKPAAKKTSTAAKKVSKPSTKKTLSSKKSTVKKSATTKKVTPKKKATTTTTTKKPSKKEAK